jgi:ADP-ribose pyrophosphatase YjhB (NUDIX family)
LLAAEVWDDAGQLKGGRPLGGGINFGESWRTAIIREFNEELGIDVTVKGIPLLMENIFVYEGVTGHEVAFISEVEFPDAEFKNQESVDFQEGNAVSGVARWFDLADLDLDDGPKLYPTGLKDLLLEAAKGGPV